MGQKLLTERFAFSGGKITGTPDAPVVEGLLLCGPVSANRRRYLKKAFEGERVKLYNGVPVKVTVKHGDGSGLYQEQIGIVQNARHRDDGMPLGDVAVNPKKPYAEAFLWDAQHQPKACAMSHVAQCETTQAADGWEDVTELKEAISVDVIGANHAATTKGLFEGKTVPRTIKQLVEDVARNPKATVPQITKLKALSEMDGMGDVMAVPAEEASPEEALTAGFKAAIDAIVDQILAGKLDRKEGRKKIDKLFDAHGGAADTKDSDSDSDSGDSNGKKGESKDRPQLPDSWAVLSECHDKGLKSPTPSQLKMLGRIPDQKERFEFIAEIQSAMTGGAETPRSVGRQQLRTEDKDGRTQESKDKNTPQTAGWQD